MNVLILAAGKGTRMKSGLPKVLHPAADKPMLGYSIDTARGLKPGKIIVVIGSGAEEVRNAFADEDIIFCLQKEQLGTADAVLAAKEELEKSSGSLLILSGDMPCVQIDTVKAFISSVDASRPAFISVKTENPAGYGRVIRGEGGQLKIVEEKDATAGEKAVNEINTGIYLCEIKELLQRLASISNNNAQREYYLTDIVASGCTAWCADDEKEFMGVNDRLQLSAASKFIWLKRAQRWMKEGVGIIEPESVYISADAVLENDVVIYPNVFIQGKSVVKSGSTLYHGVRLVDSYIDSGCIIKENTLIEESRVGAGCKLGPMAHLRPESVLEGDNAIGNFVELKKAVIGKGSKANHLTYIGDAFVGEKTNIGCGTITSNYDGFKKHITNIGANVSVGSDTQFVAPVNVGDGVIIAAGTTVTKDVPANALAISRTPQKNIEGMAEHIRKSKS